MSRCGGIAPVVLAATLLAVVPPRASADPPPVSQAPGSVSLAVDVGHTGFFADEDLVPPLVPVWSLPIVARALTAADGRVYAVLAQTVVALDQASGRTVWSTPVDGGMSEAYDAGTVYVNTSDDVLALDGATGAIRWRQNLGQVAFSGPPVAAGGTVYITRGQGGSTLFAFRGSDGQRLWSASVADGSAAVALDDTRAYAAGACGTATAVDRADGHVIWSRRTGCSGGADATPALSGGRIYHPEEDAPLEGGFTDRPILDPASGGLLGRWPRARPIFADGRAIAFDARDLVGADPLSGAVQWRARGPGGPSPVAVGHDVFAILGGRLSAVDAARGHELWTGPRVVGPVDDAEPVTAVAPGFLFLAAHKRLTAWVSELLPAPREVGFAPGPSDVRAGGHVGLTGVLGHELRTPHARITFAGGAARGPLRRVGSVAAEADGGFSYDLVLYRNSRFQARLATIRSAVRRVYVIPRVTYGALRRVGRGRVIGVSVRTPRVKLAGHRFVLYLQHPRSRALRRLATAVLRPAGRSRTRARLVLGARPRIGAHDAFVFCVRGMLRLGLGRATQLNRRCGARRLRG